MKPFIRTRIIPLCLTIAIGSLGLANVNASGLKDLFKNKQKEVLEKAKQITLEKGAKLVFPMEQDSATARPSSPLLDRFNPKHFKPLTDLKRTINGGFKLKPGAFSFNAQSYCLKPGTYQRPGGKGYMSGPIKGKLAPYITEILKNSYKHPEISQQDIQYLLWGMIAGNKLNELPNKIQNAAQSLMNSKQIRQLNRGIDGLLPNEITNTALAKLPPSAQQLVGTLQEMKRLAARPDTSYKDLEKIAVLPGMPPESNDPDAVPEGRWSLHPDGYYIRYHSTEYDKTRVEIVVPEPFHLTHDAKGRITSLSFDDGSKVETIYDDSQLPTKIKGIKDRAAYLLKQVSYHVKDLKTGKFHDKVFYDQGWIFAPFGKSENKPKFDIKISRQQATPIHLAMQGSLPSASQLGYHLAGAGRVIPIRQIYDRVNGINDDVNFIRDRYNAQTRPLSDADLNNIVDLSHYSSGAEAATGGIGDQLGWLIDHFEREQRAIARATELIENLDRDPNDPTYRPWTEAGLPGSHSYSQRRGMGGRGY